MAAPVESKQNSVFHGRIIRLPPKPHYSEMQCSEVVRKISREFFSLQAQLQRGDIGEAFFFDGIRKLNEAKKSLNKPVHAYKLLSFLFLDTEIKKTIREIFERKVAFKLSELSAQYPKSLIADRIKKELCVPLEAASQADLLYYVDDFAKEMGVSSQDLRSDIEKKDWEKMIDRFLRD